MIGYVAFSPVAVEGEELQWVGLAPLAVDEATADRALAGSWFMKGWTR